MRRDDAMHTARPWRISELTRDFRLEDVWQLDVTGGPDDFPRLVHLLARFDPDVSASPSVRALFAARRKAGELLGWDEPRKGLGGRVATLRDRLPVDLRLAPTGPYCDALPFNPLYLLADEWAVEAANHTVHGVLHLAWVPERGGRYRGQLAVYVQPNGWYGAAYMAAIKPFRYLLVYPAMLRELAQRWESRDDDAAATPREGAASTR